MFVSCSMWESVCYILTVCGGRGECVKGRRFAVRAPKLWSDSPEEIRSAESGAGFPSQICAEPKRYLQNIDKVAKWLRCPLSDVMQQKSHFKKHGLSFGRFISTLVHGEVKVKNTPIHTYHAMSCDSLMCVMWPVNTEKVLPIQFCEKKPFLKPPEVPPQVSKFFFQCMRVLLKLTCFHSFLFSICSFTFVQFQYWFTDLLTSLEFHFFSLSFKM